MKSPSLTIGMPVYNGSPYISRAINSIVKQEFKEWILVVSDNCSTDNTVDIVREFSCIDSRIKLHLQAENIGAINNFLFLADFASSPYFMWASADDEWSEDYIMKCMLALQKDPSAGFSSGSVINIDKDGVTLRKYKTFECFHSMDLKRRVSNYLSEFEIDGKANLIYSVYLTPLVQSVCRIQNIFKGWGSDMAFVAAMLARTKYIHVSDIYIYKRVTIVDDVRTAKALALNQYNREEFYGNFPLYLFWPYFFSLLRAMPSVSLKILASQIMFKRAIKLKTKIILKRVSRIAALIIR